MLVRSIPVTGSFSVLSLVPNIIWPINSLAFSSNSERLLMSCAGSDFRAFQRVVIACDSVPNEAEISMSERAMVAATDQVTGVQRCTKSTNELIGLPKHLHGNGTELGMYRLEISCYGNLRLRVPGAAWNRQHLLPFHKEELGRRRHLICPPADHGKMCAELNHLVLRQSLVALFGKQRFDVMRKMGQLSFCIIVISVLGTTIKQGKRAGASASLHSSSC